MGKELSSDGTWLFAFSRKLRGIDGYQALIELVREELQAHFGLTNAWLYVFEGEVDEHAVLVAAAGPKAAEVRKELPVAPIAGDWLMTALREDHGPIVIPDAPLIEGNPDVARRLGNRTVVNLPIGMIDKALGVIGGGTFGDEGPVPIDEAAVLRFAQLANIAAVAVARLVLRDRDAARAKLEAQLAQRQRIESMGLLAGGVAHDLNGLLTVIRFGVSFLSQTSLTDAQRADLGSIAEAERSASELTRRLLLIGRKQSPTFEPADLNTAIAAFMRLWERLSPAHIKTELILAPSLPRLRIDPSQLEQVLMNLALNARDAMPRGGRLTLATREVTLSDEYRRTHTWAKAARYILLIVTDTGTGMPPEVAARVFEPFFTTKAADEGTGLGLAVTWSILQQHDGTILCSSEPGLGTSFKIYLPASEDTATTAVAALAGPTPRGSEHILVADDHAHVRAAVVRMLTQTGYRVTAVSNGAEAVAAATRTPFDLFILDAVMPVMSGRASCERLRTAHPGARFIITSGYGSEAFPAALLQDLGMEFLAKPFDPEALLRAVRRSLDHP